MVFAVSGGAVLSQRHDTNARSPEAIAQCLNRLFWISRDVQVIREGDSAFLFVDYIGWHVTWMAAADFRSDPPAVYDTYREDNPFSRALFRRPMPWFIVLAVEICGGAYEGQLPSDIDTWVLEVAGFPSREPHTYPPPPMFYEVDEIEAILPPIR